MAAEATALAAAGPATTPLVNISEANEIFYANLEQQIALMQRHLSDILNIAAQGAAYARQGVAPSEDHAAKLKSLHAQAHADTPEVEEVSASGKSSAHLTESDLAITNLANVVASTKVLMNNAVAAHHNLDVIGEAVLAQAAALIFSSVAAPQTTA